MSDAYPPEYDHDHTNWQGSRLGDYSELIGIEPAAEALRATDKYGDGATVSVRLANGEAMHVPDDLHRIRKLREDEPVRAWIVHGIAWDGTDWEFGVEVATVEEIADAQEDFADALAEHNALMEEEEEN